MQKIYNTKPCQIEAIQFTRSNIDELKEFCGDDVYDFTTERSTDGKCYCWVHTLEGEMQATENDYIIKGLRGEFYPCKPDVFEKKYEEFIPEMSMGTVYEINKQASAAEELLNRPTLQNKLKKIGKYIQESSDKYFMLLNRETANYTLFNLENKNRIDFIISELKECLLNRGRVVSIDKTEDDYAYEIWVRDEEQEDIVYYFFPYDLGVIEVK